MKSVPGSEKAKIKNTIDRVVSKSTHASPKLSGRLKEANRKQKTNRKTQKGINYRVENKEE